jgi:hypothetical protein
MVYEDQLSQLYLLKQVELRTNTLTCLQVRVEIPIREHRSNFYRPFAMADLETVLQAIRNSVAKLRATIEIGQKSKSASRHLVSTGDCSWKNILFQAFSV